MAGQQLGVGRSRCPVGALMGQVLAFFLLMNSNIVLAGNSLPAKDHIIDLMLCYGSGTDAIGDSSRTDPLGARLIENSHFLVITC